MFAGFLKLISYKKCSWKRALNNSKLSKYSVFEVKTLHFFGESATLKVTLCNFLNVF